MKDQLSLSKKITAVTPVVFVSMVPAMAISGVFGVLTYRKGSQDERGKT